MAFLYPALGPHARAIMAKAILAYHWLTTANNDCYLFHSWAEGYLLPFDGEASAEDLTEFFTELGSHAGWEKKFFSARIARTDKDEIFSYDATNVATKACDVLDAQYGKSKKRRVPAADRHEHFVCSPHRSASHVSAVARPHHRCQHDC